MKRILALDFGEKRIGVAISDQLGKIPRGYGVLTTGEKREGIRQIKEICQKEKVGEIIIGLPFTIRGKEGKKAQEVREFAQKIKKEISLPIIFEDERFSTKEAERILKEREVRGRKGKIDTLSAVLILRQYLERENA